MCSRSSSFRQLIAESGRMCRLVSQMVMAKAVRSVNWVIRRRVLQFWFLIDVRLSTSKANESSITYSGSEFHVLDVTQRRRRRQSRAETVKRLVHATPAKYIICTICICLMFFNNHHQSVFIFLFSIPSLISLATSSRSRPLFLSSVFSSPKSVPFATRS